MIIVVANPVLGTLTTEADAKGVFLISLAVLQRTKSYIRDVERKGAWL